MLQTMRFPRFLAILAFALSATLSAQNLTSVKVDSMSDDEIRAVLKTGAAKGLDVNEGEKLALSMGLPQEEAAKFKARVDQLNGKSKPRETPQTSQVTAANPEVPNTVPNDATLGSSVSVETAVLEQAEVQSEAAVAIAGTTEESTTPGDKLPVNLFGQQFFRGADLRVFERSLDAKAPDSYVLGEGDEIGVSVYGTAYFNEVYKVDSRGSITIKNIGTISVRGLTFAEMRQTLKGRMMPYFNFNSNEVAFTLAYSRTITVNIVGEVVKPGSYKLPAVNTAFNALMASGGPSDLGTLRDIKVVRNGKVVRSLDVYKFLLNPVAANDYYLQDNDYIQVGTAHNVVTVTGAVKRPMRYEMLPGESIQQAIDFAGGFQPNAYTAAVQIKRLTREESELFDISAAKFSEPMQALDVLTVRQRNDDLKNFVSVNGAVMRPGSYRFEEGVKLTDLIARAGGINTDSLITIDKAWLVRQRPDFSRYYQPIDILGILANHDHPDNVVLKIKDELTITLKRDRSAEEQISISGAVRDPFTMKHAKGITVKNMLEMAGGLQVYADISKSYIVRTDTNYNRTYIPINLEAILSGDSTANLSLEPRDGLTILSKIDKTAEERVSISGAVRKPFEMEWAEGLTVRNMLEMANGIRFETFGDKAYLTRIREDMTPQMIELDLASIMSDAGSKANLVLEPRDAIRVLTKPDFDAGMQVSIGGAVRNPQSFTFAEGMTLGDVLRLAGGLKPNADYQRVEVSRLNAFSEFQKGTNREVRTIALLTEVPAELVRDLSATSPALDFKLQPYDQIVVREIPEYKMQEFVYIGGEVQYPGYYPIMKRDEKLSSLIGRAGGPTRYADIKNATLTRTGAPNVVVNLRKAILNRRSPFNYTLLPGDALEIPRTDYLVSIVGTGHKYYENASKLEVNVPYSRKKSARFYVKEYALGFAKKADKAGVYVDYPNGNVDRTKNYGLFKDYPSVKKGGTIHIAMKPEKVKEEKEKRERKPFDMNQAVATVTASLTSFATLYVLLTR